MTRRSLASSRPFPGAALAAIAGALLLASVGFAWLINPARVAAPPDMGGPFSLTDDTGRQTTDRDLRGRYLVLYFGYTHCRDVCPATLTTLTQALDTLGPVAHRIQPVFITVDPARDTPETVHRYVRAFSAQLIGLTGTPAAIGQVETEFRVTVEFPSDPRDAMTHSSVLYLIGPDGAYRAPIRADASAAAMAASIRRAI